MEDQSCTVVLRNASDNRDDRSLRITIVRGWSGLLGIEEGDADALWSLCVQVEE